uniref:BRO1 domain-containing protein n=1 Tax=Corethron hystrix TaxID=216773 RepID=A0A7S1BAZ0_9STRA|mmetsp:Transcript_19925/g.45235  ORF Transcript_19925/g.45235 Transcript_19925/m.45235 type:complete len:309 (+) Transcript_19925:92-1018(+)
MLLHSPYITTIASVALLCVSCLLSCNLANSCETKLQLYRHINCHRSYPSAFIQRSYNNHQSISRCSPHSTSFQSFPCRIPTRTFKHHSTSTIVTLFSKLKESEQHSKKNGEEEVLTVPLIAELIEVSFIHACMQLSSGYVDVLKGFLAATKAAYERGVTLDDLGEEISLYDKSVRTAGRDLAPEELALRRTWLATGYATLRMVNHPAEASPPIIQEATYGKVQMIVETIVPIKLAGKPFQSIEAEEIFSAKDSISQEDRAFLMTAAKVSYMMIEVLNDEKLASRDLTDGGDTVSESSSVPGPSIPGTR